MGFEYYSDPQEWAAAMDAYDGTGEYPALDVSSPDVQDLISEPNYGAGSTVEQIQDPDSYDAQYTKEPTQTGPTVADLNKQGYTYNPATGAYGQTPAPSNTSGGYDYNPQTGEYEPRATLGQGLGGTPQPIPTAPAIKPSTTPAQGASDTTTTPSQPTNGPDIARTFPGYYANNPNVEQQYQEWRDARRSRHEDPFDMEAFRKHLVGIGAPDPGTPQTYEGSPYNPGASTPAPQTPPAAGTTPAPTTTPPVGTTPPPAGTTPPVTTTPGGTATPTGDIPGVAYNPAPRTGTAQDLFKGGLDLSNLGALDLGRIFPHTTDAGLTTRNILRGLGFNVDIGNPFTAHLQQQLPDIMEIMKLKTILGGQAAGENTPNVVQNTVTGLGGNPFAGGGDILSQLVALQRRNASGDKTLTGDQLGLASKMASDPRSQLGYLNSIFGGNVAPDLQRYLTQGLRNRYEKFSNSAEPNKSFLELFQ